MAGNQPRGLAFFPPGFLPLASIQDLPQGAHQEPCPVETFLGHGGGFFLPYPGISQPLSAQAAWPHLVLFCPPSASAGVQIRAPQRGSEEPGWHGGILTAHGLGYSWESSSGPRSQLLSAL